MRLVQVYRCKLPSDLHVTQPTYILYAHNLHSALIENKNKPDCQSKPLLVRDISQLTKVTIFLVGYPKISRLVAALDKCEWFGNNIGRIIESSILLKNVW